MERVQQRGGEIRILFIPNSLKLLQKLKVDCRHVCKSVCVCLSVSVVSCLPSRALTVKALRLTRGTAHLSLAQKPSPCLGH